MRLREERAPSRTRLAFRVCPQLRQLGQFGASEAPSSRSKVTFVRRQAAILEIAFRIFFTYATPTFDLPHNSVLTDFIIIILLDAGTVHTFVVILGDMQYIIHDRYQ